MFHDQMMVFLQSAVVFLLLTNAISALVAIYAMKTAKVLADAKAPRSALERKIEAFVRRTA